MNLAQLAEQDNTFLLEDDVAGFAHGVTFQFQDASVLSLKGDFVESALTEDPVTGVKFPQARASVTVATTRLMGKVLDDTVGVTVDLAGAVVYTGLVQIAHPDMTLGWTVVVLTRVGA